MEPKIDSAIPDTGIINNTNLTPVVPIQPSSSIVSGSFESATNSQQPVTENKLSQVSGSDSPVPVVKVLSVRGVEYVMMSIALWICASGLIWLGLSVIYSQTSFNVLAFPVSLLIVCLPIFSFFYLRLRKQELINPELKMEPSKRRLSQITQVLAFIVCLFNLIGYVYMLVAKIGGDSDAVLWKATLGLLVILIIAGGILAYYWFDEHRNQERK